MPKDNRELKHYIKRCRFLNHNIKTKTMIIVGDSKSHYKNVKFYYNDVIFFKIPS